MSSPSCSTRSGGDMDAQDTLDAAGAAAVLHADAETVLLLARRGELPGAKIGKSWVFLRADVLDFLRDRVRRDTAQRLQAIAERQLPAAVLTPARRPRQRRAIPDLSALAVTPRPPQR